MGKGGGERGMFSHALKPHVQPLPSDWFGRFPPREVLAPGLSTKDPEPESGLLKYGIALPSEEPTAETLKKITTCMRHAAQSGVPSATKQVSMEYDAG